MLLIISSKCGIFAYKPYIANRLYKKAKIKKARPWRAGLRKTYPIYQMRRLFFLTAISPPAEARAAAA